MSDAAKKKPKPASAKRDAAAAGDQSFPHLRLHTEYSLRDGMLRLKPGPADGPERVRRTLATEAARRGISALAITDENNLFGAVKFHKSCVQEGVKPIIGCELSFGSPAGSDPGPGMLVLCKDQSGYFNLSRLVTGAYERAVSAGTPPWADPSVLDSSSLEGLIALSGWRAGEVGQRLSEGDEHRAREVAARWKELMGDRFYFEIQRVGAPDEEDLIAAHLGLAAELGIPVACTHPVQFLAPEDFEAHEVLVCIYERSYLDDQSRPRRFRDSQYLKSAAEMRELFADLPEAVRNAEQIAVRCNFSFEFGKVKLPVLEREEGAEAGASLAARARKGLDAILAAKGVEDARPYVERLDFEVQMINEQEFADYFLIVADIVSWAKQNEIPVGPGRGSGAGSLVAYSLGITGLDPLEHGLLFERFLNPGRKSMPDFDIDFCPDNRDRLIQHVRERYGQDCVSQICTFGTLGARAAVRSVGRPLGMSLSHCDRIARAIPHDLDMTLARAKAVNEELRREIGDDSDAARLFELAQQLEGLPRNVGTHAGGVLIAPDQLVNYCPLYATASTNGFASHFDKDDVEAIGLVKFDFLGLAALTTIAEALVGAGENDPSVCGIEPADIPLDDPEVYGLFARADTTGVFQCESPGMRNLMSQLKPDCFEEIVALLALFRPGPLESKMADDYIARKHDNSKIDWIHDSLRGVLGDTRGVVVYQEQVMQIAQILADYSLGDADLLRRAMGKKKPEEMAKHKEQFVAAAAERLNGRKKAAELFVKLEKFAGYGFNKSHAAAYAFLAVQTAWLKRRHPAAFFAASLSSAAADARSLVRNAQEHKLRIAPPDVNCSEPRFRPEGPDAVRFGLCAIKGIGLPAAQGIVAERQAGGKFKGIDDYLTRTRSVGISRKGHEMLAGAGALDSLHPSRAQALELVRMRMEGGIDQGSDGQESLFGEADVDAYVPDVPEWSDEQRLAAELEATGLTLSGHFFDAYAPWIKDHCARTKFTPIAKLEPEMKNKFVVGVVVGVKSSRNMTSKGFEALVLDDSVGKTEILVDQKKLRADPELRSEGSLVVANGRTTTSPRGDVSMRADEVWSRERWVRDKLRQVRITLDLNDSAFDARVEKLRNAIGTYAGKGTCGVRLRVAGPGFNCDIDLGDPCKINPGTEVLGLLETTVGKERVKPVYF